MSKSYWFGDEDQKGNFSNDKMDTFDPKKRYVGIRLQQGVPLLDRDWNELEDIRRHEEQMLRRWYIGNGTPDDGFRIMPLDVPGNDFKIKAGRYLVDGFEAVNDSDILYSAQKDGEPDTEKISELAKFGVFLDVWIEEVNGKIDPALANEGDVKMETCIRHKLKWRVRVGRKAPQKKAHHYYSNLAEISLDNSKDPIKEANIIRDFRRTGLALFLLGDKLATNKLADDLHRHSKLVARDGSPDPALSVDNSGRVGIGTTTPNRILHVEDEIHSGGKGAGFSFADQTNEKFFEDPTNGERWRWYSTDGVARLWSGGDKLTVDKDGNLETSGAIRGTLEGKIRIEDTRDVNTSPNGFNREVSFDLKKKSAVGLETDELSGMMTLAPDSMGVADHQLNFNGDGIFWRKSVSLIFVTPVAGVDPGAAIRPRWGSWQKIVTEEVGSSDRRFKTEIMPLNNVLDKLDKVRGISFEWNDLYKSLGYPSNGGRREIGLIAQEVEVAFPELVTTRGDEKYRILNYERLTAVLVEAVKELRAEVEALKKKINS
jgi:hypothetical protein